MPLDDLPVHIRANGVRRRREALGLTVDEVAAHCDLLPFSVQKAEQGLEESQTYRILETWLDDRERETGSTRVVPRPRRPARQAPAVQQQQQPRTSVEESCEFEMTMDGVTLIARGPADRIESMGAIVRSALAELQQRRDAGEHPAP